MKNTKKAIICLAVLIIITAAFVIIRMQPEKLSPPVTEEIDYAEIAFDDAFIKAELEHVEKKDNGYTYDEDMGGKIVRNRYFRLDGDTYYFYPEYADIENAINITKKNCSTVLQKMRSKYLLICDFTSKTWPNYCNRINKYAESLDKAHEMNKISDTEYEDQSEQLSKLSAFLDIAENKEQNDQLSELVEEIIKSSKTDDNGDMLISRNGLETLVNLMPDDFARSKQINTLLGQ